MPRNKPNKSLPPRCRAFTLVEVMAALLILALALTALQLSMTQHVNNSGYLRDKTIAGWIAQNRLELLRLENRQSNALVTEERRGSTTMAGRQWYWRVVPLALPDQAEESRIVPLAISVAAEEDFEAPLVTLDGVVDGYHRLQ